MSARPCDLATDTRWCPSRTKYSSPTWYSDTGGSASPRRWAAAIRSQRERRRGDVGRKPRSKSAARSTVPTIESSGTTCSPRSSRPTTPSASITSSNGRMSPTSSGSRRSRRATSASRRARRAREKSPWASAEEKPEELTAPHYGRVPDAGSAGGGGVLGRLAGERRLDRRRDGEHAVEAGDLERLGDRLVVAHD